MIRNGAFDRVFKNILILFQKMGFLKHKNGQLYKIWTIM